MIGKLLNKFKGSEYYLELKEDAEDVASQVSQTAAPVTEAVTETAAEVTKTAADNVEAASDTVKQAPKKAKKTKAKKKVKQAAKPTTEAAAPEATAVPEATAAPQAEAPGTPAVAPAPDPVDIIRAALASTATPVEAENVKPQPANFATDYLVSTKPAPRRRPGPSLSKFKTMAKDVNK